MCAVARVLHVLSFIKMKVVFLITQTVMLLIDQKYLFHYYSRFA